LGESSFTLTKWYMDCVTAAGETAILYSAVLGWRGLSLNYNSILMANAEGVASRASMAPARVGGDAERIEARAPRLGVEGCWSGRGGPFRAVVYEGDEGVVDWNCLQPGARVRLRVGERELDGEGYAECLTVTVPPWRLPMKQLRWGRFVSEEHSLVWIDWQGSYSKSLAVIDGRRCALRAAGEKEVVAEGATLRMSESLPLRAGELGATVLPSAPRLRRMLPRPLAAIRESKWRSRGVLTCGDETSNGWVIHEVVHWDL
jgi:hypothetical protein